MKVRNKEELAMEQNISAEMEKSTCSSTNRKAFYTFVLIVSLGVCFVSLYSKNMPSGLLTQSPLTDLFARRFVSFYNKMTSNLPH